MAIRSAIALLLLYFSNTYSAVLQPYSGSTLTLLQLYFSSISTMRTSALLRPYFSPNDCLASALLQIYLGSTSALLQPQPLHQLYISSTSALLHLYFNTTSELLRPHWSPTYFGRTYFGPTSALLQPYFSPTSALLQLFFSSTSTLQQA